VSRAGTSRSSLLAAMLVAVASGLTPSARAGDRPLELLLGDMSPDGGPPDCMRTLVREIRRSEEEIHLIRLGESGIRRLVGREGDEPFVDWTMEDLQPLLDRRWDEPLDAIALVDCRQDEPAAEMLLLSPAHGLARVVLRGTPIDEARASWLGQTLLMHAWTGFSP
jgi:hypothetical protein